MSDTEASILKLINANHDILVEILNNIKNADRRSHEFTEPAIASLLRKSDMNHDMLTHIAQGSESYRRTTQSKDVIMLKLEMKVGMKELRDEIRQIQDQQEYIMKRLGSKYEEEEVPIVEEDNKRATFLAFLNGMTAVGMPPPYSAMFQNACPVADIEEIKDPDLGLPPQQENVQCECEKE